MKVLFLDFDGVLNHEAYLDDLLRRLGEHHGQDALMLDTAAIERLNRIVELSGCEVVISSSWRHAHRRVALLRLLRSRGFEGEIAGVTPTTARKEGGRFLGSSRGAEIQVWLDEHPAIESFAILDDNDDMEHLSPRLIQTTFTHGLREEHVELVVAMLNRPS